MVLLSNSEILFRLLIAAVISGIVGFDREYKNRPAGIRTHILVCTGATIIALIQRQIGLDALDIAINQPELRSVVRSDEARLIAQVVSGIGFLGAGTIIVTKEYVKGLTTAASLWVVAGIGLALGMGYYEIAGMGFVIIMVVLSLLNKIIRVPTLKKVEVSFVHKLPTKEFLSQYFEENHIKIRDVNFDVQIRDERRIYTNVYTIELPKGYSYAEMVEELSLYKNIVRIRLISV
ncbi:MgtC/SapB family protein [Enterococcus saccharolyticus]|uniref:MgtC/SapB family protein n=1 Tax=Enterococcus TaxID=1350 RepID=UPI00192A540D|nr:MULTISPECIES: MgtC/SapB family protein [Enterococcus]MCD5002296.1 MgtC/SapB family protein [Enterococcus saccharolyticus]